MMRKKTPYDFKFIKLLGEGSFSSVYLAVDANVTGTSKLDIKDPSLQDNNGVSIEGQNNTKIFKYAIKVCQKSHIKRQAKIAAIMREKEIMNILNKHPNKHFMKLHFTFQDVERLYFVMTYAENGELLTYMQENPLSLKLVIKYSLQMITALEHLHKLGIVHRDLKPENILLNQHMDILITDFGSAQLYDLSLNNPSSSDINPQSKPLIKTTLTSKPPDRRNSFVGTAQYVSPEMLKNREASNKSDLWALGVIIYQMVTNIMPFNAPNEYHIYKKIQSLDYNFTEDFDPKAKSLVSSLIKLNPLERLGATDDLQKDGYLSIRRHEFLYTDFGDEEEEVDDLDSIVEGENEDAMTRTNSQPSKRKHNANAMVDPDLIGIENINPGLDESQLLRLLTVG